MNTTKIVKTIFIYYYKISLQWISTNYNREEKSLRHVVLVAKFLDDNIPKIHQKENLHRFKLHRSYLTSIIKFVKVGDIFLVESERTVSKLRKKKTKIFELVHRLHEAGAWNYEVSCRSRAITAKKWTK